MTQITQHSRVLVKRSTVAGVVPTVPSSSDHTDGTWSPTDIYEGELFINTVDEKAYYRASGSIVELAPTSTGSLSGDTLKLNATYTASGAEVVGETYYDTDDNTYSTVLPGGVIGQHFQETFIEIKNDTGADLTDGKVIGYAGTDGNSGNLKGEYYVAGETSSSLLLLGIATQTISDGETGKVSSFGKVRGIQTDGANYGETWLDEQIIYASTSSLGGMTNVMPNAPHPAIPVAVVVNAHGSNGTLFVRPTQVEKLANLQDVNGTPLTVDGQFPVWDNTNQYFDFTDNINNYVPNSVTSSMTVGTSSYCEDFDTYKNFWNGTIRESFNALVVSDGTTISMSLAPSAGPGDLTMNFSDGAFTLNCTPSCSIGLTAGTVASPQENYVYIPLSTKVLTTSTTTWPAEEHIKVSYFFVQTAAYVQSDGALINQNWNDHIEETAGTGIGQGHLSHITERVRKSGAVYYSGLDGGGSDDYTTSAAGDVTVQMNSGIVYQMHKQTIGAKDTSGTDDIHVLNAHSTDGGAYYETQNLYDITLDTAGGSLNNTYFNVVLWAVANKGGEYSPLFVNVPGGSYNNLSDAQADVSGYDVFTIPREFTKESSTGVLVCRLTFRKTGGTWAYQSTTDLRGLTPLTAAGGGAGGTIVSFQDNQFNVYDNTDATKRIFLESSGITTGTDRTWTSQDASGIVAYTNNPDQTMTGSFSGDGSGITGVVSSSYAVSASALSGADLTDVIELDVDNIMYITGSQSVAGEKTFTDNLTIIGDLYVSGSTVSVSASQMQVTDNTITVNYGEPGSGVTAGTAGIIVDRGTATNYEFIFDETTDTFRIGEAGTLQAVATREDAPVNLGIPYWVDADTVFSSSANLYYNPANTYTYATKLNIGAGDITLSTNEINGSSDLYLNYNNNQTTYIGTGASTGSAEVGGTLKVNDYTLPAADGTDGQVMTTNGAGSVTWEDVEGGTTSERVLTLVSSGDTTILSHSFSDMTQDFLEFKYTSISGSNRQVGNITLMTDGTDVNWNDNGPTELGDTSNFNWDFSVSGVTVNMIAQVTGSWNTVVHKLVWASGLIE